METMVPTGNGELWADDSGGDGLPLVLLHPGVGDSTIWDPVLPALTARHRVIRYDVRGFGRSPAPTAAYSLVEDLATVLDHFGTGRAVLVGSSMGGATSISLALDDPDRVAGLALLVPGITGYDGLTPDGFYEEVGELANAGDMEGIVRLGLSIWGRAGGGTPDADPGAAAQLRGALPAWFSNIGHQGTDAPAFERLGKISAPTLLALGELDQPELVRCNEEMADRIPGCRLVRLAGCDHYPTLRDPETVVQLIEELYAGVTRPQAGSPGPG